MRGFIPKPVAAFLNEVHPPRDQLPPINVCATALTWSTTSRTTSIRTTCPPSSSSRRWEAQSDSGCCCARQREGVQEAAVHNMLIKNCTDMNNRPEEFPHHPTATPKSSLASALYRELEGGGRFVNRRH